jgi:hypothetical protein
MSTIKNITVNGQRVEIHHTAKRFAAVCVRDAPVVTDAGTYVPFADARRTSASDVTIVKHVAKMNGRDNNGPGVYYVAIDIATGEEI